MDQLTSRYFSDLQNKDSDIRYEAYKYLMKETQREVDWAYEVWDQLVSLMEKGNNHERTIAAQLICNLAKSDPEKRIIRDVDKILAVTKDEKFVTARHTLQSLWKIGIVSREYQDLIFAKLSERYAQSHTEKNFTLTRYDILENFRKLFDQFRDERIKEHALSLIAAEKEPKYQQKYAGLWRRS